MILLWSYFWPILGAALVVGLAAGLIGFRPSGRRYRTLITGLAGALAFAAVWHGPLGAADRFSQRVERDARDALNYYEMAQISAKLQRGPLTRRIQLAGSADDFQTSELARVLSMLPGVTRAQWNKSRGVPMIVEAMAAALVGFLLGLVFAYLVELHRRHNAQFKW